MIFSIRFTKGKHPFFWNLAAQGPLPQQGALQREHHPLLPSAAFHWANLITFWQWGHRRMSASSFPCPEARLSFSRQPPPSPTVLIYIPTFLPYHLSGTP